MSHFIYKPVKDLNAWKELVFFSVVCYARVQLLLLQRKCDSMEANESINGHTPTRITLTEAQPNQQQQNGETRRTSSEQNKERSTSKQIILGLIAYLTSVAPSMSLGFSAVALPALEDENNLYKLDPSQASWVASIASVATPIGCFVSGPISDRFGRRTTLLAINVVSVIGWLIIVIAYYVPESQYSILLVGRLITGLSTGLSSMPPAVYMAEVSSAKLRGVFTTASAVFFALGILIVYIFGYIFLNNWGAVSMVTAIIPTTAFILTAAFLKESPTWLVSKGKIHTARANMANIFGFKDVTPQVDEQIELLLKNYDKKDKNSMQRSSFANSVSKKIKLMKQPTFYKPFTLLLIYFFFVQFSGIFVVIFYAINIVRDAGITYDNYAIIILVAATRVVTACFVSIISKSLGRRPLSLISGGAMTICMAILSAYIYCVKNGSISEEFSSNFNWIPAGLLVLYFSASTIGFLTVPFAMNAELFPTKVRGLGSGLTTCCMYAFNFVAVKTYPSMVIALSSHYVFLFYGAMSLLATVYIAIFLPETRGKTLQEIQEMFTKKKNTIAAGENLLCINDKRANDLA